MPCGEVGWEMRAEELKAMPQSPDSPDFEELYLLAESQAGHFTTAQAAKLGYSPQLLRYHVEGGKFIRARRGIYRLRHFPASPHEKLTVYWLWSKLEGVYTGATGLLLQGLLDAAPEPPLLLLPQRWRGRRVVVPPGVRLAYAEVPKQERRWCEGLPVAVAERALNDALELEGHTRADLQIAIERGEEAMLLRAVR